METIYIYIPEVAVGTFFMKSPQKIEKRRYQRNWGLSWESGDFFDKEEGQNKFHKYIKIDTYIDREKNVYILDDTNR